MDFQQLEKSISQIIPLDKEDYNLVESLFNPLKINKNTHLAEVERPVKYAFFINSGYIRYYKTLDSGEELTIHLYGPNNFATSLNSFFSGSVSDETMQSLTDCDLLCISKENLEKLYATSPKWQYFGRKLMEGFLIEKEQRVIDQLSMTAQQRYAKLFEKERNIVQNVQVKYLASFLGIKPESLSRIKKQIN